MRTGFKDIFLLRTCREIDLDIDRNSKIYICICMYKYVHIPAYLKVYKYIYIYIPYIYISIHIYKASFIQDKDCMIDFKIEFIFSAIIVYVQK